MAGFTPQQKTQKLYIEKSFSELQLCCIYVPDGIVLIN